MGNYWVGSLQALINGLGGAVAGLGLVLDLSGGGIGELWPIDSLSFWINFTLGPPTTTLLMT